MKHGNGYMGPIGDIFDRTPKAVFAAVAVSLATCGGDYLDKAQERVLREWWVLYDNHIVPQKPPFPRPADEEG